MFTLTEATLVADQWGAGRYAVINGVFNAPVTAAGAIAPTVGAGIAALTGSYPAMFVMLAAVAATGAALAATSPAPAVATPRLRPADSVTCPCGCAATVPTRLSRCRDRPARRGSRAARAG